MLLQDLCFCKTWIRSSQLQIQHGVGGGAKHEHWLLWHRAQVPLPTPTWSPPSVTPVSEDPVPSSDLLRHIYSVPPMCRQARIHIKVNKNCFRLAQNGERAPEASPLSEELLAADSCWEKSHFSPGAWPLVGFPSPPPRHLHTYTHKGGTNWSQWSKI